MYGIHITRKGLPKGAGKGAQFRYKTFTKNMIEFNGLFLIHHRYLFGFAEAEAISF